MKIIKNKYRGKAGLPPGTLIHIGKETKGDCRITVIDYDEKNLEEKEIKDISECLTYKDKTSVTWINIDGLHKTEIIETLGNHFGIHFLVLEDILNTAQRSKFEDLENYIFVVLKMIYYSDESNADYKLISEQVSLIIGKGYVISFQEMEGDLFDSVRKRIRNNNGRIRKLGADYLAYALIDTIVDNYFIILETTGEKIELLEDALLDNPQQSIVKEIHSCKRDLITLRKAVWPLREVTAGLEKSESPLINKSSRIYLRDVYDHTMRIIDTVETSREIIAEMFDIYLSSTSSRMNRIMTVLAVISTVFMPLTFLAGVYGMNFRHMPELGWKYGYPLVLIVMAFSGTSMILYFKKKKWL